MASDRKQYKRALAKWDLLHEAKEYSVPAEEGRTAIICSQKVVRHAWGQSLTEQQADRQVASFVREAIELADCLEAQGRAVDLTVDAIDDDMVEALQDREVSDIIAIGHGSLSTLQLVSRESVVYDWRDVSQDSTHLKLGKFIQRHCGHISRHAPVPLGTFAMASMSQVIATTGEQFAPDGLTDPQNFRLQPVTRYDWLPYDQLRPALTTPTPQP